MVTSIDSVGNVVVVELDVDDGRPPLRSTPSTVKPAALSAVTLPVAKAKLPNEPPPRGNDPPLGKVPPPGVVPPVRDPPPRPPPPKNEPAAVLAAEQVPLESGWVMTTLVALSGPVVEPVVAGVPVAMTQSPTATFDAATVTVWLKEVDAVQLTVT